MKIIVKELFEQGLPKNQGGMLKMLPGTYAATPSEAGPVVKAGGRNRTIPTAVVEHLKGLGLISVE